VLIRLIFFSGSAAQRGLWPPRSRGFLIIHNDKPKSAGLRQSQQDSSGRVISSSQRLLPDNTQHTQQTNIRASCGIRTHYRSRRGAVDLHYKLQMGWAGTEPKSRFSAPVQTGLEDNPAYFTMGTDSLPGVKRLESGFDHPPSSSAEVNERVELYVYFSSGPSWPVLG
jgi:hypothetical protein